MARQLVDGMTSPLALDRFTDEYRRDLMRLIEEKAERGEVNVVPPPEPVERPTTPEVDLMSMLKKSLQAQPPAAPAKTKEKEAGAKPRKKASEKRRRSA